MAPARAFTKQRGRSEWYVEYTVRVCRVEYEYGQAGVNLEPTTKRSISKSAQQAFAHKIKLLFSQDSQFADCSNSGVGCQVLYEERAGL